MEKRILLAFVLSFAVLYGFSWLFPARQRDSPTAPAAENAAPQALPAVAQAPLAAEQRASEPVQVSVGDVHAENVEDVVVDTGLYTASLSNEGGVLRSFKLKAPYTDAKGMAIELINQAMGGKVGWPLSIATDDGASDQRLDRAKFVVKREALTVTMEFAGEDIAARKTIEFDPQNYQFSVVTSLSRDGKPVPHRLVWQSGFGDQSLPDDPKRELAVYDASSKFQHLAVGSVKGPQDFLTARAGVEDQYFLAIFLLPQGSKVKITKADIPAADGKTVNALRVESSVTSGQPMRVYVGPKDENWLKKADPGLEAVVDYGWFEIIAKPLLLALLWVHSYVGNFGWAIIILTCAINLVLFPLRVKSQVSMQKMQKIQPQLKTLMDKQKKLKATDPRRAEVQAEIMKLYNEHGVNPMGGCLPMLLQMPFLIGFYKMLSVSIELRGAPWILWIRDLSQYDPYYVIPILMAVSMVVTQKMTPTTVDPAQAKMMMLMPLMMTVIFLWAQSGLTLYWLTSNLVGIGQQWFIRKYWGAPAAEKPEQRLIRNRSARTGD